MPDVRDGAKHSLLMKFWLAEGRTHRVFHRRSNLGHIKLANGFADAAAQGRAIVPEHNRKSLIGSIAIGSIGETVSI